MFLIYRLLQRLIIECYNNIKVWVILILGYRKRALTITVDKKNLDI